MGDGEEVLHREKIAMPWPLHLLVFLAAIGGAVAVAASGANVALIALPIVIALALWTSMATLRTTVSKEKVHVQYGIFGPSVDVQSIRRVEPVEYNWMKYGGWGIRYSVLDGTWAYNVVGDGGRGVEIEYDTGGKSRTIMVASREPMLLADAIQRARAGENVGEVAMEFDDETTSDDAGAKVAAEVDVEAEVQA